MSKKKTPAIVAKVEKFINAMKITLAGLLTCIQKEEARDASEFSSRLRQMEIYVDVHAAARATARGQYADLEALDELMRDETSGMIEKAEDRVEKIDKKLRDYAETYETSHSLRKIEDELKTIDRKIKSADESIAYMNNVLKDKSIADRKVVEASRLEIIERLDGFKAEKDSKETVLQTMQLASDKGYNNLGRQLKAARTRVVNVPAELTRVSDLFRDAYKRCAEVRRTIEKSEKLADNKLSHLRKKAEKRGELKTSKIHEDMQTLKDLEAEAVKTPEAITIPVNPCEDDMNARVRQVADELGADLDNDADRAAVRALVQEEFPQARA